MFSKTHSIVFVFIGLLLFLAGETFADIEQAKQNVLNLITQDSCAQAKAQTRKLIADYPADPCLAGTLYLIARQYEWSDKYSNAKAVYQQMTKGNPDNPYIAKAELGAARADVLSLILSQNYDQAKRSFDKMAVSFSGHPDWGDTLYWIAERYKWAGRYEDAKEFYRKIIRDCPSSPYAERAKLGIPRAEVQSLIRSYDFTNARKALDKMAADFNDHPDMPETLYWCAEKYKLSDNFEEEKAVYQQIMQKYPDSPYAKRAELEFKRASISSLIVSQNYGKAKDSLDKLSTDLKGHKDLPATLYSVAERYRWSNQYEEEKTIYQQILQSYPDSSYAEKAKLGIARADIQILIESQDFDEAEEAFNKLVADFENNPGLQDAIYWIARSYGWTNRYEDERRIYQFLIQKYPNSKYAAKADVGESKADVTALIASEDYNSADAATDKLVADFNNSPDLPSAIFAISTEYYEQALQYKTEGRDAEAEEYVRKAMALWERIITEFYSSAKYTPQAYFYSAFCYEQELGEYEKAIEYYQKLLDNWPNFDPQRSSLACLGIASCYEKLANSGEIPASEAAEQICLACNRLIKNYPNISPSKIQTAQRLLNRYQDNEH